MLSAHQSQVTPVPEPTTDARTESDAPFPDPLRRCKRCGIERALNSFAPYHLLNGTLKRRTTCNPCYGLNRNKEAAYQYSKTVRLYQARHTLMVRRASVKGVACTITVGSLEKMLTQAAHCPACGVEFTPLVEATHRDRRRRTVDRIDSNLGYTEENCVIICHRCNSVKNDVDASYLRRLAAWLDSVTT